jgi:translocation and assembly module TamB
MALPGEGRQAGTYRLTVVAHGVSLRYPAGVNSRGNAEIVVASSSGGRQITGLIDLERALYVEDFAVGTVDLLRSFLQRQRQVVEETDTLLATTQLNVLIRGPGALRIRNNLADLTADVDLTLRGTLARPVVFGRLEAREGGEIVWNDTTYGLQRATVTFNNPYRIEPIFDLVASTEVKSFDITLTLEGPLEKLRTGFSSNADLADLEILSLLTTGDSPSEAPVTPGQPAAPGVLAQQFLYGQAASALSRRVGTLFGFDRFRIDPLAGAGESVSSVGVTVGKRLSRDVFVTYSSEPTSDRNYVVQVEWQVARNVTLVLTQAGDGSYAVDAQWERRF